MKVCRCLLYTLLLILLSCNSEDSFLPNDIIVNNDNENNQYIDHNRWTYEMMSKHYFWNKDIADSLSLDFSISPKSFFDNLLSKEDRFSWCEINENYNGEDLGFQYQTYEIHGSKVNRVLYVTSDFLIEKGFFVTKSQTNFLFVKHPQISGDVLYKKVKEEGILIRHFATKGIDDFVRITIGTKEQMSKLKNIFEKILAEC